MSAVIAQPDPRLRHMAEADLPEVSLIEARTYEFPWSEGIFRDCVRAGYHCIVCEIPGAIVAYAVMSVGAGECHLLNLSVDQAWQRRGLGTRMIEALLEAARTRKARVAILEVRRSNRGARDLYRRLGFEEIGCRRGYYPAPDGREDALVLGKVV